MGSTDILNIPLFMTGSTYFDAAASWYKDGLPTDSAGKSTGGMAPPSYTGNGRDFLDSYFRSGLQTGGSGTAAASGSSSNSANAQILKKSSAYWVATTHVQYNLDMADINIAANTDIGSNATTMSIYGVANKRAVNYKTEKSVPGGTASATSPGTTKSVAQLNIDVGAAFNAATPTAATVQAIRDGTNTIFAQAAQRYIAKITLAAHMPGNGMGGSTRFDQVITAPAKNPSKGYWQPGNWGIWKAADKAQATACGGDATQMPQAQEAPTGNTPGTYTKFSLQMNGGLACSKMTSGEGTVASNTATFKTVQPKVSQNGSGAGTTTATPTAVGTAVADACPTVSGIQAVKDCIVGSGAAGSPAPKAPYEVPLAVARRYDAASNTANGGLSNDEIKKATRGIAPTGDVPADTVTPTACIGPDVIFNDVVNSGAADGQGGLVALGNPPLLGKGVALCDPNGYKPADAAAINGAAQNGGSPLPSATRNFDQNKLWYSGVNDGAAGGAVGAGARNGVLSTIQKFWDPITAAQASGGAFCCDALYYGKDGVGRGSVGANPPIVGVTKNANFTPNAIVGAAMDLQVVPGGVCTDGVPTTSVKEGLSEAVNAKQEEFLEGQAFYACVAPSQYVLPKVNSVAVTQTANAAKQKTCAQTLTKMLKLNQVAAGVATDDAKCKTDALVPATEANQALPLP